MLFTDLDDVLERFSGTTFSSASALSGTVYFYIGGLSVNVSACSSVSMTS